MTELLNVSILNLASLDYLLCWKQFSSVLEAKYTLYLLLHGMLLSKIKLIVVGTIRQTIKI